ncbi:hypothetical protein DDD63_02020 [Actinobaculum sp. 313]|nr:hypothetical protein DDD63_02020 [Actinobaculum sp. 313]
MVADGEFAVSGDHGQVLFELAEAALDRVEILVGGRVEGMRSSVTVFVVAGEGVPVAGPAAVGMMPCPCRLMIRVLSPMVAGRMVTGRVPHNYELHTTAGR